MISNCIKKTENYQLTMSSREIAELVESRHADVKRSIDRLSEKGIIDAPPTAFSENINNLGLSVKHEYYIFKGEKGKRDSIVVIAQICPEFTARLVDRWQELENAVLSEKPANVSNGLPQYRIAKAIEMTTKAIGKIFSDLPHLSGLSKQVIYANTINPIAGTTVIPLPVIEEQTYSATEAAKMLNTTAHKIGVTANRLGIKTPKYGHFVLDKSRHSAKQVETFRYNQKGLDALSTELNTKH